MIAIRKLHLQYVCFQRLAIDFTGIKVLTADLGLKYNPQNQKYNFPYMKSKKRIPFKCCLHDAWTVSFF